MVLIFQFSPGFGTEASGPGVPWYLFWYLGFGSYFTIQRFRYTRFSGGYLHLSHYWYWYWFGSISVPFRLQIRWNLKLWYWIWSAFGKFIHYVNNTFHMCEGEC